MRRFTILSCFLFVALLFGPLLPLSLAAEVVAPSPDYGGVLAEFLSIVVFPILAAVLLGLVGVVLNKVRQKYNLTISAQQEAILDDLVRKGIAYAEERAAAALKKGVARYTGNQKADEAIAFILSQSPHLPMAAIEAKVMAWLGMTPGVGATGNKALGYLFQDSAQGETPAADPVT